MQTELWERLLKPSSLIAEYLKEEKLIRLDQRTLRNGSAVMAAMATLPVAPLLCMPQLSHASAASVEGTNVAIGAPGPYSYSFGISQPTTSQPFRTRAVSPTGSAYLEASYDGASEFSLQAGVGKNLTQSSSRAQVQFAYLDSIVNTGILAQQAILSVHISRIAFSIFDIIPELQSNPANTTATFAARIYRDSSPTPLWVSSFAVTHRSSTYAANESGASIGLLQSYQNTPLGPFGQLEFTADYLGSINLGVIDAGSTLDLRYEVDLSAEMYGYGGSASLRFDDPVSVLLLAPIPEPSPAALLAAGLALLVPFHFRLQRRRSRHEEHDDHIDA